LHAHQPEKSVDHNDGWLRRFDQTGQPTHFVIWSGGRMNDNVLRRFGLYPHSSPQLTELVDMLFQCEVQDATLLHVPAEEWHTGRDAIGEIPGKCGLPHLGLAVDHDDATR